MSEAPINILIVDDDPRNLTVLETILDDPGYRLVRAESADQALLALVVEEDFSLLILDIRMPGMTGLELATLIKARKKTAQVPIIFLTAYYNEDQHVLEGYGTGAVDYLQKPVNPGVLRSKVAVFAELHRKGREVAIANRALLTEVSARRRAEADLRLLNETLEQRVTESSSALVKVGAALREKALALEDSHRRKDQFLAMLGHELRNPLAPLASAVQFLGLQKSEDPLLRQALVVIERQVGHLKRLIDDLLDASRITSGRVHLQEARVAPNDVMEHAVQTVRPLLDQRRHELTVSLSPHPIWLFADAVRLEQLVVNLLINAAKYTDEGGRVWLSVQQEGDECVVRVRDTGVGIDANLLPYVFNLFSQAERSLDRSQGGLGIGLALVRGIAKAHGGSVEAHSTPGEGSEFVVRLPVMAAPAPQPTATEDETAEPIARSLRVLVVDDNEDLAVMLGMLLKQSGHEVQTAYDGPTGLEAALDFRPNVVLLDVGLPGIDGYEVARRLRQQDVSKGVVLVAITGYGLASDLQLASAAGFDHHLLKPPDFSELLRILAAVP